MPTLLITGTSSGLGLALLTHYSHSPSPTPTTILAIDTHPFPSPPPHPLGPHATIHHLTLDLSLPSSLAPLTSFLLSTLPSAPDLVYHSAGIRGLVPRVPVRSSEEVKDAETLEVMDVETMQRAFAVNCGGAFLVLKALAPFYASASPSLSSSSSPPPRIIIMGSRMGSLSLNSSTGRNGGGAYAYRASKAALNAVVRSFSVDVPGCVAVVVHPGRVETGLVRDRSQGEGEGRGIKVKEDGAIGVEEAVQDLVKLVEGGGEGEGNKGIGWEDRGRFVDRWGRDIEW
ncbi:MAG: hypothetical protein Q9227_002815 [Pyrenula ochraceoflavens]